MAIQTILSWKCSMQYLLKPNQFSTVMAVRTITAKQWSSLIENPLIVPDKTEAPLAIWGSLAEYVTVDPAYKLPRCTAENLSSIWALQIDVDNGCRIDEFERDYHRYSYQLYTSYSYGFKEGHRFRVIFPLKEKLYTEHLVRPVKDILHEMFPMVDDTCFDRCHWQILPAIRANDAPYEYRRHDGEILSFARDDFAKVAQEYKESAHWKREIAEADRDPRDNHDGALRWVQTVFDATGEGSRNRTVYAKLRWLKDTVGATYGEVLTLRAPAGFDTEMYKMIERIYGAR